MVYLCIITQDSLSFQLLSGYVKIAIEHGPVEIVDLPIEKGWFSTVMLIYQAR